METVLDEANAVSLMLYLLDRTDKPASATDLLEVVKNYNRIKALAPYSPEDGKEFVIATIFLKNDGWAGVDTNAYQWEYAVGGITYSASTYTFFSDSITYDSVTVNSGGSATFQIVYEVPSGLGDGIVRYDGYSSATVVRDNTLL